MSPDLTEAERLERMEQVLLRMPNIRRQVFLAARLDHMPFAPLHDPLGHVMTSEAQCEPMAPGRQTERVPLLSGPALR